MYTYPDKEGPSIHPFVELRGHVFMSSAGCIPSACASFLESPGPRDTRFPTKHEHVCGCGYGAGFIPYTGTGYQLLIPSKWNPSKEKQVPGVDIRLYPPPHLPCFLPVPLYGACIKYLFTPHSDVLVYFTPPFPAYLCTSLHISVCLCISLACTHVHFAPAF